VGINKIGLDIMINKKNKNVICAAPWMHLYIHPNGIVYPCCTGSVEYGKTSDTNSIKNVWHSDVAQKFRKELLAGKKQSGCKFCYNNEKFTGESLRTSLNLRYSHLISSKLKPNLNIKYLDIRSSNLCNMACIMCGSEYSSKWYDDEIALGSNENSSFKSLKISDTTKKDILTNIINDTLETVYFAGGEPLIIPYHYEMLDYMIKNDYAKNTELRYNTNLSTLKYKSVDLLKKWSSFKNIILSPSIDMIGEHGEYHRYGSNWNIIVNNLKTVKNKMPEVVIEPQVTVTSLSIGYLPELLNFFIKEFDFTNNDIINVNLGIWPSKLNPQHLLPNIKEIYIKKLQNFLNKTSQAELCSSVISPSLDFLTNKDCDQNEFFEMINYLNEIDKIRKTNWKELWPEIWKHRCNK